MLDYIFINYNLSKFAYFQDEKNQLLISCLWLNLVSFYVQYFHRTNNEI